MFLLLPDREALYGGGGGGGKSDALLMGGLQFVHLPGYAALILRRSFSDLSLPGALIPRSQEWLINTPAKWIDREHTWLFPSGATITFGYLSGPNDKFRYASSEFQYIGWDELTQFPQDDYRFLFTRLRRLAGVRIPLRMRGATNPIGEGAEWVEQRFLIDGPREGRIFIPALMDDNPHLDQEGYRASLAELDPITRMQMEHGVWGVKPQGTKFKRENFRMIDELPPEVAHQVRWWDLAATDPTDIQTTRRNRRREPDWTVGARVGYRNGDWYIIDIVRDRLNPAGVQRLIKATAESDTRKVPIRMEQEPGASGVAVISNYATEVLPGYDFRGIRSTGEKLVRMRPLASAAENGHVYVLRREWTSTFLDELCAIPYSLHDDQADAAAGAQTWLTENPMTSFDIPGFVEIPKIPFYRTIS